MRPAAIVHALFVCLPTIAGAAVLPVGAEFQINSYTNDNETYHLSVSADADGDFVVVWGSLFQDGSSHGIFGQRYDSAGAALGTEFQVNSYTPYDQYRPSVSVGGDGDFVVVWESYSQDGYTYGHGIFGQRYDSAGAAVGTEFQANSYTLFDQYTPSVSVGGDGNFVVVWESRFQDGSSSGVFGQRFDSAGSPLGAEFQVNTYTTNTQLGPSVSADGDGDFVVVWHSSGQDGSSVGVFGRRFDSAGAPVGTEFQINTYTTGQQWHPSVSADGAGKFVVVWESGGGFSGNQDGDSSGIFGQRYDSAGAPIGAEFQVNAYTTNSQRLPSVSTDGNDGFVVVWESPRDGSSRGVFGRRYDSAGTPVGAEFQVNSYTTDYQIYPAVAWTADGEFVVVWQNGIDDGDIFGQRFEIIPVDTPTPTATPTPGAPTPEVVSTMVAGGGTVTTDTEADGATANDSVETSLTLPNGGSVTIEERPFPGSPGAFFIYAQEVEIDAPAATAGDPIVVVFELHQSILLPQPFTQGHIDAGYPFVFKDAALVANCTDDSGQANPDPCVASRVLEGDGDVLLTILTSTASVWQFAVPSTDCPSTVDDSCQSGFGKGLLLIKATAGKEKLIAKFIKGPALLQTDLGNPLFAEAGGTGTFYSLCIYDQNDDLAGQLANDQPASICDGKPCWKSVGKAPNDPNGPGKGYLYKDAAGVEDGIEKLLYKGGDAGKSKAQVKGKGGNLPAGITSALQSSSSITVQLRSSDGECLSVELTDVKKATADLFKAKSSAP